MKKQNLTQTIAPAVLIVGCSVLLMGLGYIVGKKTSGLEVRCALEILCRENPELRAQFIKAFNNAGIK